MVRVSRATFAAGSIAFIFIGALHTYVHVAELSGAALQDRFETIGGVALQGNMVSPWDLFQGVSLLMGFFSMALGALLMSVLAATDKSAPPPAAVCFITMAMLASIMLVGAVYLSSFQVIGGALGIICFGLPMLIRKIVHS